MTDSTSTGPDEFDADVFPERRHGTHFGGQNVVLAPARLTRLRLLCKCLTDVRISGLLCRVDVAVARRRPAIGLEVARGQAKNRVPPRRRIREKAGLAAAVRVDIRRCRFDTAATEMRTADDRNLRRSDLRAAGRRLLIVTAGYGLAAQLAKRRYLRHQQIWL